MSSVCFSILSYNHPDLTARAVRSVVGQGSPILLVHNGSLPQHVTRLQIDWPQVEHIVLPVNKGFSGGANVALQKAFETSERCFFITNDCELTSFDDPRMDGLYIPKILIRGTEKVHSLGGLFQPNTARLQHCIDEAGFSSIPKHMHAYVPATAFLVDKKTFEQVGLFDESLGTYWEDVDWSMRAHKNKVIFRLAPEIVLRHGIGKTCHKDTLYTIYYYHRNARKVSWRYSTNKLRLSHSLISRGLKKGANLLVQKRWRDAALLFKAYRD